MLRLALRLDSIWMCVLLARDEALKFRGQWLKFYSTRSAWWRTYQLILHRYAQYFHHKRNLSGSTSEISNLAMRVTKMRPWNACLTFYNTSIGLLIFQWYYWSYCLFYCPNFEIYTEPHSQLQTYLLTKSHFYQCLYFFFKWYCAFLIKT